MHSEGNHIWVDLPAHKDRKARQVKAIDLRFCPWAQPSESQGHRGHPAIFLPKKPNDLLERFGVI